MTRPNNPAGTLGRVSLRQTASGTWEASAWLYDHQRKATRLRVRGGTPAAAEAALRDKAEIQLRTAPHKITAGMTVAEAVDAWLSVVRGRVPRISQRTVYLYETWGRDLVNRIGKLTIRELATAGDCDAIIMQAGRTSASAAAITKKTLSLLLGTATRHGALDYTPVRDTERLEGVEKIESALDGRGLHLVLEWVRAWRLDQVGGTQPDRQLLEDALLIMAGTSARPGEALAIRRCDTEGNGAKVAINGKVVNIKGEGAVREDFPKRRRQARVITLPEFAQRAVQRRMRHAPPGDDMTIFATSTGRPRSVSNLERLVRTFRDDHATAIRAELKIPLEEFTCKLFRRTAATAIDRAAGIDLAAGLLGHADTATTRRHYAVTS